MPDSGSPKEGWQRPPSCQKFHYFVHARSLCGSAWFPGDQFEEISKESLDSPDEDICKVCLKTWRIREFKKIEAPE